jgi:hypothetical protein
LLFQDGDRALTEVLDGGDDGVLDRPVVASADVTAGVASSSTIHSTTRMPLRPLDGVPLQLRRQQRT